MNVVLAGPVPPFRSGIADQTARLARAMARLGERPLVVTFSRLYPRLLYPGAAERAAGGFPPDLDARPLLDGRNPFSFARAARAVAAERPRLVILPFWTAFLAPHDHLFFSVLERKHPAAERLLLCHNLEDHGAGMVRRRLARAAFAHATRFVVQNRADAEALAARVAPRPVECVPHPSEACGAPVPRAEARRRLGLPAEVPLFLFSGLLRPYKGWDLLLAAWPAVRAAIPEAELLVAGEAWGDATSISPIGGVRLDLRFVPAEERSLQLSACDAVVCPYRRATGSGIAADALAHGRPLVGTRVPGLEDVVADGESGLLVPPEDPAALAAAMVRFVREGLAAPLAAGAARAAARFGPEEHARRVLAFGGIS